jgi:hypothetical protein
MSPEITQQGRTFAAELDDIKAMPEGPAKVAAFQDWRRRLGELYGRRKPGEFTKLKGED